MYRNMTQPSFFDFAPGDIRNEAKTGALLNLWAFRWQSRRALRNLPDELLSDIGITRAQALEEAAKPFWRA